MLLRSILASVSLLTVASCFDDPDSVDEPVADASMVVAKPGIPCEDFVCGNTNSPEIDHLGLHELNLSYPNYLEEPQNHFKLLRFEKAHVEYIPTVVAATLTATQVGNPSVTLHDQGLVGARFVVVNTANSARYVIQIFEVGQVEYYAKPTLMTPTYHLQWVVEQDANNSVPGWKEICTGPLPDPGPNTLNLPLLRAVLFEGDRVSAPRKVVTGVDPSWMNIGCSGHLLSKLHLTGHSQAAKEATKNLPLPADRLDTTPAQRTAMVKLLAADYCGTGDSWTIAGQDLGWRDDKLWMQYWPLPNGKTYQLEGRWTDAGVSCLNTPRIVANFSPQAKAQFGDNIKDQIAAVCPGKKLPDPCPGTASQFYGYHLISANPQ